MLVHSRTGSPLCDVVEGGDRIPVKYARPEEDEVDPYDEVPCQCEGLSHRSECPNWVLPY